MRIKGSKAAMPYTGPSTVVEPTRREAFWEDCNPGAEWHSITSYTVSKDEMVSFANKWDPLSFHVDEQLAKESVVGQLFASSRYTLAVSSWLLHRMDPIISIVAAMEITNMKLPRPTLPGMDLRLTMVILDRKPYKDRSDRGIVRLKVAVLNQDEKAVLEWEELALVNRRPTSQL